MHRHGLFSDFSVALQSRIYGFALSLRLESQLGAFPEACFVAESCDSSSPEARSVCLLRCPAAACGRQRQTKGADIHFGKNSTSISVNLFGGLH